MYNIVCSIVLNSITLATCIIIFFPFYGAQRETQVAVKSTWAPWHTRMISFFLHSCLWTNWKNVDCELFVNSGFTGADQQALFHGMHIGRHSQGIHSNQSAIFAWQKQTVIRQIDTKRMKLSPQRSPPAYSATVINDSHSVCALPQYSLHSLCW